MIRKRLFYDLETSQIVFKGWRTGQQFVGAHQILHHTKIISVHWSWEGEDKVHNLDWGLNKQCDKRLLKKFIKELNKADEIVAHNGNKFDIKWIRTRASFHGLHMRPDYNMIDTYKLSKTYLNLPSYSLKEVCKYYGLEAKIDAGGVTTWDKIQFDKDREALDHLLYYGDGDITSLKAVYEHLKPYVKSQMNYAVLRGGERYHCPECGSLPYYNKMYVTVAGTPQHYMKCPDEECGKSFKINNKTYEDYIQHKIRNNIR